MMTHRLIRFMLMIALFGSLQVQSQDLESLLERYAGDNASGYVEPLVSAFGANMNSGWYYRAKTPQSGFHFNIRLNAMATMFKDDQRTFTASTEGYFTPVQDVETPTIIGNGEGTSVSNEGFGTVFTFPGGYDIGSFALAVPTLTIGSIAGTEASIRYISATANEDIGEIKLFGYGLRHNISQYFPTLLIDVSAGFGYTKLDVGDILNASATTFHLQAGKSFSVLNLYGGLAYESSSADISYTYTESGTPLDVNIEVDGKNKFRMTFGAGLSLLFMHLNIDYNIGSLNLVNAGLSFGL